MNDSAATLTQLSEAARGAQKALAAGDKAGVRAALTQIRDVCDLRFEAGGAFDGMVTMQGVSMALEIGDRSLAQELCERMLRDAAQLLEQLNEQYRSAIQQEKIEEAWPLLYEAYACAATFIPSVLCPEIPWLLKAFAGKQKEKGAVILWLLHNVVPKLVRAGWDEWPYPAELAARANRAAAQTLVNTGNQIMENPSFGLLVEQGMRLALNALALLPPDSRDQLMADCENLLGQVYMNLGPVYYEIHCLANLEQWTEAFEVAENVKFRLATVQLRYVPLGMVGSANEPLIQEETTLLGELNALAGPIEATLLANPDASQRLEEIWAQLQPRYPDYVALRRQETLSAEQTAKLLDETDPPIGRILSR